jgi:hypothetical protein
VPIVLKSGNLKLLEPSGPVKACNGIALTLTLPLPLPLRFERTRIGTGSFDVVTVCTGLIPQSGFGVSDTEIQITPLNHSPIRKFDMTSNRTVF